MPVMDLLFVYGSLMPSVSASFGRAERERLKLQSELLGTATIAARLYDLGSYPGLVVDRDGGEVHGEVLRLLQPEVSFSWLDAYEGIVQSADASNEYRREIHPVSLAAGATIEAWVYVYNCAPPLSARITSGRWAG